MNMMIASNTNSITLRGVIGSFTTPNAKSKGPTFSQSLFFRSRSLDIVSSPSLRHLNTTISAVNSGLEASITDSNDVSAFLTDVRIVEETGDENKIQALPLIYCATCSFGLLRVELTGDQTQKVFDRILINLGRTAPPVPGFRLQKGGKSSKIPKSFLLQMLGEERVTKFAIQEILNCTMADYTKKENLDMKDRKVNTTQTVGELKQLFKPGKEFGFNVIIEPESDKSEGK